jgi:hypothetical protein
MSTTSIDLEDIVSYEDFLNEDRRTISTLKVIFGMWKFRNDFRFVTKLAEILR